MEIHRLQNSHDQSLRFLKMRIKTYEYENRPREQDLSKDIKDNKTKMREED